MPRYPAPDRHLPDVLELEPAALYAEGIRAVFLDMDNTLGGYHPAAPSPEIAEWIKALRSAGIAVRILSNSAESHVSRFAGELPYTARSGKPRPDALLAAIHELGLEPRQVLMVGDRYFSDIRAAHAAGTRSAWVRPHGRSLWRYVRWRLERLVTGQ